MKVTQKDVVERRDQERLVGLVDRKSQLTGGRSRRSAKLIDLQFTRFVILTCHFVFFHGIHKNRWRPRHAVWNRKQSRQESHGVESERWGCSGWLLENERCVGRH